MRKQFLSVLFPKRFCPTKFAEGEIYIGLGFIWATSFSKRKATLLHNFAKCNSLNAQPTRKSRMTKHISEAKEQNRPYLFQRGKDSGNSFFSPLFCSSTWIFLLIERTNRREFTFSKIGQSANFRVFNICKRPSLTLCTVFIKASSPIEVAKRVIIIKTLIYNIWFDQWGIDILLAYTSRWARRAREILLNQETQLKNVNRKVFRKVREANHLSSSYQNN